MHKIFTILALVIGAYAAPQTPKDVAVWTYGFTEANHGGNYQLFTNYVPDLRSAAFDNSISSVWQMGMWLYFENVEYNQVSGKVYWVHGVELEVNFPNEHIYTTSSLKYVGRADVINMDTWTVYEGPYFTGSEYYGEGDKYDLETMTYKASSLIVTGTSPWTFYTGTNWSGYAVCVYPNTDHDVGTNGVVLDYGIFINLELLGLADGSIGSVRKGCWSQVVAKGEQLQAEYRAEHGAWGVLTA